MLHIIKKTFFIDLLSFKSNLRDAVVPRVHGAVAGVHPYVEHGAVLGKLQEVKHTFKEVGEF